MQKQYRLGIPSFITVETEDGSWIGEKDAQKTEKEDIVRTMKEFIPNFKHIEKGKNLDQKM